MWSPATRTVTSVPREAGRPAGSRSSAAARPPRPGSQPGACRTHSRTSARASSGPDVGEDGHVAARFGPPGAVAGRAGQRPHRGLRGAVGRDLVLQEPDGLRLGQHDGGERERRQRPGAAAWIAASRSPVAPVGSTIATMACTSSSAASSSRHWRKASAETGAVVSTGPVTVPRRDERPQPPPGQAARVVDGQAEVGAGVRGQHRRRCRRWTRSRRCARPGRAGWPAARWPGSARRSRAWR